MEQLKSHHRPLTGGLGIQRKDAEGHHGTLTAVARRQDDNEPVLVTNRHVVASSDIYGVQGDESVYQWHANNEKAGTLYTHNGRQSWAHVALGDDTSIDVASLTVEPLQGYDFGVHEHDSDGNHRKRPIVQPVREAEEGDDLVQIGARSGVQRVTVDDPDTVFSYIPPGEFRSYRFPNVVRIDRGSDSPIDRGDSGSPLLWKDTDGNFHLCCINFSAERNSDGSINRDVGYAIPASSAQRALNVTFGVQAPIADAGEGGQVVAGVNFSLDGRGSRAIEPGATITEYRWEQTHITAIPSLGTDTAQPTFTAPPRPGTLTFKLTVTDSNGAKHSTAVTVTVVNTPPTADPGWNQAVPVNTSVTLTGGVEDSDPGHADEMDYEWSLVEGPSGARGSRGSGTRSATRSPSSRIVLTTPIENGEEVPNKRTFTPAAIGDYVFTLTVTDPGDLTHSARVTIHACATTGASQWYDTGKTRVVNGVNQKWQTRVRDGATEWKWLSETWGEWEDAAGLRNISITEWADMDPLETQGSGADREKLQIRDVSYEEEQSRTSNFGNPETQWVVRAHSELRWVPYPEPETTEWEDVDPPETQGCGPNKEKKQTRLLLGVREYQYVADPEELEWTDWADVTPEETQNRVEGGWTDTGNTQQDPVDDSWEKEQTRTVTYQKKQFSESQCEDQPLKYSWLSVSTTETRWMPLTTEQAPTTAPSNIRITTKTSNSVTIAWDALSGATGYTVKIGIPASAGGLDHTSDTTTGTSIIISNLLLLTTYEYRVKATNGSGPGPWSDWATVVTKGQLPPTPDLWDAQYDNNKIQVKVTTLPPITPQITHIGVSMETGQPPNLTTITKRVAASLNEWITVLSSTDTGYQQGRWVVHIRFENSVGESSYVLPGKPVTVPTTTTTHVWTFVEHQGCGPSRKKLEACSNGHTRHTRLRSASEPFRWGRWYNTEHERNEVVGPWRNTSNYRGCGPNRERQQAQTITWENEQERQSHCGHTENRWVDASTTDTRWLDAPEADPWGSWSYTGGTDYDDIEDIVYYEQERFSSPCNRRDTRWVTTRP